MGEVGVDAHGLASLRSKVRGRWPRRNAKAAKKLATIDHKEHRKEEQNFVEGKQKARAD
jgi:hypothetical protein